MKEMSRYMLCIYMHFREATSSGFPPGTEVLTEWMRTGMINYLRTEEMFDIDHKLSNPPTLKFALFIWSLVRELFLLVTNDDFLFVLVLMR
jgi:hypothetical protein